MPMDPMTLGSLVGAGTGMISNGIQAMFSGSENKAYQNNQQLNYQLSQEAQRNAARNMVEGYKMAGLSPALVSGAPQAASMASAPMQNKSAMPVDVSAMLRAAKDIDMLDAQKANLEEDTRTKKIENDRKEQADSNYNTMMINVVKEWRDKLPEDAVLRQTYDDILSNPEKFNKGSFDTLKDVTDFSATIREIGSRASKADLDNLVYNLQQKDGIYKDIAKMPSEDLQVLLNDAKLKQALAANAAAQEKTEGERLKTLQKQQKELEAKAANIAEDTRRLRYGKYGNMYEHGDLGAMVAEVIGQGAESASVAGGQKAVDVLGNMVDKKLNKKSHTNTQKTTSKQKWKDERGIWREQSREDFREFPAPDNP